MPPKYPPNTPKIVAKRSKFTHGVTHIISHTPYAFDKKTPNFAQGLDFLRFWARFWDSRHSQVAIYTVFHEESESEVEKCQILEPGGKE